MVLQERQKTDAALEAIEQLGLNARPVPLTNQVRFELQDLLRLIEDLREALTEERGKSSGWS